MILDYAPMLPSFKIEKSTFELIESCQSKPSTSNYPTDNLITLLVTFAPLSLNDITYLNSLFQNFPSTVKVILDEELLPNKETIVTIKTDCNSINKLTNVLSNLPYTLWIEQRINFKVHNRWARGLCQSGDDKVKPLYEVNITGQGYIIGVADTGIDMTHCQFYDPNTLPPYDKVNLNHRKVIYYNTFVDNTDDSDGHGTHVSSTTSGKSYLDYGDFR